MPRPKKIQKKKKCPNVHCKPLSPAALAMQRECEKRVGAAGFNSVLRMELEKAKGRISREKAVENAFATIVKYLTGLR